MHKGYFSGCNEAKHNSKLPKSISQQMERLVTSTLSRVQCIAPPWSLPKEALLALLDPGVEVRGREWEKKSLRI